MHPANEVPPPSILGRLIGGLLSPFTGTISALRQSRVFHPLGSAFAASVESPAEDEAAWAGLPGFDPRTLDLARAVGPRLLGSALVRFSGALWKSGSWPDVLGCALRFTEVPENVTPLPDDQDLLLASIRRPWTMAFSPFATARGDYLGNSYYGVSPFVASTGSAGPLIEWRLTAEPARSSDPGAARSHPDAVTERAERLRARAEAHDATLVLGLDQYPGSLHLPKERRFVPVVRLRLLREVALDQEALRFNPFRNGRGVVPVGLVHNARRATYATSQAARPAKSRGAPGK